MRTLSRIGLVPICISLFTGIATASTTYTYVAIPTSNNIQTGLISTFPTGVYTPSNNTLGAPFNIVGPGATNCGPSGNASCNFYDGFSGSGQSITMKVSVSNPTDVYTLMNAYTPAGGQELASIQFLGTNGTSLTYQLVGGSDIRDFYQGGFTNTLNNGISGVTAENAFLCSTPSCQGAGGTGNVTTGLSGTYVVDEQDFSLGSTFAGQTLTSIVITDTYGGSTPLLLGATIASGGATSTATPEPSSVVLLAMGVLAAGVARKRLAS